LLAAEGVKPGNETYGNQQGSAKSQNLKVFRELITAQDSFVLREARRTAGQVLEHNLALNRATLFPGNGLKRFMSGAA
jgi:hypothetical protein